MKHEVLLMTNNLAMKKTVRRHSANMMFFKIIGIGTSRSGVNYACCDM